MGVVAGLHLPLILLAAFAATASPGPTTLALAGTAMAHGRRDALSLAAGVTLGSFTWSVSAALGLSAIMLAHGWVLEVLRYLGAAYLALLAVRSARSALSRSEIRVGPLAGSRSRLFGKGLALHLTNPKAILFFGSLYAVGVPATAGTGQLALVIAAVGLQSAAIFHLYACAFSIPLVVRSYMRLRRWFEGILAIGFGAASVRIATARLQ